MADLTVIKRPSPTEASVTFTPDAAFRESGIAGQFVVRYDVDRTMTDTELLVSLCVVDILLYVYYFIKTERLGSYVIKGATCVLVFDLQGGMYPTTVLIIILF